MTQDNAGSFKGMSHYLGADAPAETKTGRKHVLLSRKSKPDSGFTFLGRAWKLRRSQPGVMGEKFVGRCWHLPQYIVVSNSAAYKDEVLLHELMHILTETGCGVLPDIPEPMHGLLSNLLYGLLVASGVWVAVKWEDVPFLSSEETKRLSADGD